MAQGIVQRIVRKAKKLATEDVQAGDRNEHQHRRQPDNIAEPVGPGSNITMQIAECRSRPEVKSTFFRHPCVEFRITLIETQFEVPLAEDTVLQRDSVHPIVAVGRKKRAAAANC